MSWDAPVSASIMVLSFRQSEQTSHTVESTDFFTDVKSTALPTCWHVSPDHKIFIQIYYPISHFYFIKIYILKTW